LAEPLWLALAMVLVFEGLLPFLAPGLWRRVFSEVLRLQDGQIRFFGLLCLLAGALIAWWLV
jgi:uncharacterized protein